MSSLTVSFQLLLQYTVHGFRISRFVLDNIRLILSPAAYHCPIEIDIVGREQYFTWFQLWGAAVSVVSMCVLNGKGGVAVVPGSAPYQSLSLDEQED